MDYFSPHSSKQISPAQFWLGSLAEFYPIIFVLLLVLVVAGYAFFLIKAAREIVRWGGSVGPKYPKHSKPREIVT